MQSILYLQMSKLFLHQDPRQSIFHWNVQVIIALGSCWHQTDNYHKINVPNQAIQSTSILTILDMGGITLHPLLTVTR